MPLAETYYLIDFENVNEEGLLGAEKLGNHDYVHLFSTKNAPKISIQMLAHFNKVNLFSHEIPVGNQSLDMHLVSYLGYLLGTNINEKCKYIIVSKDTDYDNIISFWKNELKCNITRQSKIAATSVNNHSKVNNQQNSILNISQRKQKLNTSIQQAVSAAGYSQQTIGKVASIVVKHFEESNFEINVHNELKTNFPKYSDLYKIVKPIMSQFTADSAAKKDNTFSKLNNEVSKVLSSAGFKNDIINYVNSLITKYNNSQHYKQTIYKNIVSKYGQKRGVDIYRSIKNKL